MRKEKNRSDSARQAATELEAQLKAKMEELTMAQDAERVPPPFPQHLDPLHCTLALQLLQKTQSEHLRALDHRHRALLATSARQETHIADLYRTIAELSYGPPLFPQPDCPPVV